jgi:hypothetical protein
MDSMQNIGNLMKIVMMVIPTLWTTLYARTKARPATVFYLTLALALVHSEVMVPLLWPGSEDVIKEEEESGTSEEKDRSAVQVNARA